MNKNGVWDFSRKKNVEEHCLEMPVHKYGTAVRGIDWNPDIPEQFVTCGEDACLRFWDTRDPFCYYLNSCSTRNPLMSLSWLNGVSTVLVASESVAHGDSSSTMSGTRVFSIIHRPTMNLTAETIFQFEDYVPWSIDVCINVPEGTETMAHDPDELYRTTHR